MEVAVTVLLASYSPYVGPRDPSLEASAWAGDQVNLKSFVGNKKLIKAESASLSMTVLPLWMMGASSAKNPSSGPVDAWSFSWQSLDWLGGSSFSGEVRLGRLRTRDMVLRKEGTRIQNRNRDDYENGPQACSCKRVPLNSEKGQRFTKYLNRRDRRDLPMALEIL